MLLLKIILKIKRREGCSLQVIFKKQKLYEPVL